MRNKTDQDIIDFIKANQKHMKLTRTTIVQNFPEVDEDVIHNALFRLRRSGIIAKHSPDFSDTYYTV